MQPFTERQLRLARLIADGLTYEEMGKAMGVSGRTAKADTDALRRQLGVKHKRMVPQILRALGVDF